MNERKRALRSELAALRARLSPEDRAARSLAAAARIEEVPGFLEARLLAIYAPLGAEVDTGEIARRAAARGVTLAWPRALPERRLAFAAADPGALVRGPVGALEPPPAAPAVPPGAVDCVVVPCLGVSPDGARLGRGGGHYDVALPALVRALRIGLAFELQLVPALPREPHDAALDAVVTEARTLLFSRESKPPGASPT